MREILRDLLTHIGLPALFQPLTHGFPVVFMLHRFLDEGGACIGGADAAPNEPIVRGHDSAAIDRGLRYLRSRNYDLISLSDLFIGLRTGRRFRKAIAFTMDDGYADQAEVGVPLFEAHDCPLTIFLTTGFLDGQEWLWWDRVEYIFRATRLRRLEIEVGGESLLYRPTGAHWVEADWSHFIERCKRVPEAEKQRALARLAEVAGVDVPRDPPPPFRPMTWDQVRAAEERGIVTFGPHTVTHPILSRVDDVQVRRELEESWRRLRQETSNAQPIFGYPNGWQPDYGAREIAILRERGFIGAMAVQEEYVDARSIQSGVEEAFRVPRFSYPGRFRTMVQRITGVDRVTALLRSEGSSP